jgi:hypothetical protein
MVHVKGAFAVFIFATAAYDAHQGYTITVPPLPHRVSVPNMSGWMLQ